MEDEPEITLIKIKKTQFVQGEEGPVVVGG